MFAGTAISNDIDEANWKVSYQGVLPGQFITQPVERILRSIFKQKKHTSVVTRHSAKNDTLAKYDQISPPRSRRIWYEVDVDDNKNGNGEVPERLLYSNDGLLFAMFDHTIVIVVMASKVYEKKKQEKVMLSRVKNQMMFM
ncbi:MAG: hypothetical protein ACYDBB_19650 [Armatimonadota bacterium]